MRTANLKWIVKIPAGEWMAGVHRFGTKHEADSFVRRGARAMSSKTVLVALKERPATDHDIIARAARRAGKEGNRRFFERLQHAEKEQRTVSKLKEDAARWRFVATHPKYQGSLNGYPTFTRAVDAARAGRSTSNIREKEECE